MCDNDDDLSYVWITLGDYEPMPAEPQPGMTRLRDVVIANRRGRDVIGSDWLAFLGLKPIPAEGLRFAIYHYRRPSLVVGFDWTGDDRLLPCYYNQLDWRGATVLQWLFYPNDLEPCLRLAAHHPAPPLGYSSKIESEPCYERALSSLPERFTIL